MGGVSELLVERGKRYGTFADHALITQRLKMACQDHKNGDPWQKMSNSQREAIDMILHKVGRIMNGDPNYADSWVDICGYAQLVVDELPKESND